MPQHSLVPLSISVPTASVKLILISAWLQNQVRCDVLGMPKPIKLRTTGIRVQVYNRLQTMQTVLPAAGQLDGSYLTGWSSAGLQ